MVTHKGRSPRYISDANTLEKYGASIIRDDDEEDQPIGIEIAGWSITTSSSSIGNEGQMEELTSKIEETVEGTRRIILPEIVYVNAFVSAKYKQNPSELAGSSSSSFKSSSSSPLPSSCTMEIRFSAQDALMEWASCHNHLPPAMDSAMAATDYGPASESSYKGISIIKTVDAKLWEERQAKEQKRKQMLLVEGKTNERTTGLSDPIKEGENTFVGGAFLDDNRTSCSTEFNYDWTYSTPYTGTIVLLESEESKHKDASSLSWDEMETSGLDMELLSDQTQPILYFDDVHLYEDDMHDNGYVSLRCKIRVMPTCFFILLSLFVRVDHVLIRVKEVRFFSKFSSRGVVCDNVVLEETEQQEGGSSSSSSHHDAGHTIRIFRDVTWRECSWDTLAANGLSSHIGSWRIEDDVQRDSSQQQQQQQQQRIQGMIRMLPQVQLPMDICRHCSFQGS